MGLESLCCQEPRRSRSPRARSALEIRRGIEELSRAEQELEDLRRGSRGGRCGLFYWLGGEVSLSVDEKPGRASPEVFEEP